MDTNFLTEIFNTFLQYISVPFILTVNLVTYFAIKLGEMINGASILSKIQKKGITFGVVVLFVGIYKIFSLANLDILILSALLTPYTYNYVMKTILKNLNVAYKEEDVEVI